MVMNILLGLRRIKTMTSTAFARGTATGDFPAPATPVKRHTCGVSVSGLLRMSQISRRKSSRVLDRLKPGSERIRQVVQVDRFCCIKAAATSGRIGNTEPRSTLHSIHHTNDGDPRLKLRLPPRMRLCSCNLGFVIIDLCIDIGDRVFRRLQPYVRQSVVGSTKSAVNHRFSVV